ncbi:hypothetical protein SOVF_215750, partial [Spinacia oleracea]
PSEVVFSKSPFWVRLLDVPFGRRNPSFAYDIGEDLGGFIEFDDSDPLGWEAFMRIKVLVDIDKPLRRVVKVASGGRGDKGEKWIGLKDKERKWVNSLRGSKAPRPPSYNDTNAVRLGPPSAARKLLFAPAKSPAPSPPPGFENHPLALAANPSAGDQNQKGWTTTPSTATPLATPMLQKEAVLKPSVPSTEPTGDVELFQGTSKPVANHPSVKKPKKWTKISRADQAGKQDEVARNDVKERGKRSYRETEVEEVA